MDSGVVLGLNVKRTYYFNRRQKKFHPNRDGILNDALMGKYRSGKISFAFIQANHLT